jgi:hypothetical protein
MHEDLNELLELSLSPRNLLLYVYLRRNFGMTRAWCRSAKRAKVPRTVQPPGINSLCSASWFSTKFKVSKRRWCLRFCGRERRSRRLNDDRDDAVMAALQSSRRTELSASIQDTIVLSHCGIVRFSESLACYLLCLYLRHLLQHTFCINILHLELVRYFKLPV